MHDFTLRLLGLEAVLATDANANLGVAAPDAAFDPVNSLRLDETATTPKSQTFQNPLIKEYTLNHIRDPIII